MSQKIIFVLDSSVTLDFHSLDFDLLETVIWGLKKINFYQKF